MALRWSAALATLPAREPPREPPREPQREPPREPQREPPREPQRESAGAREAFGQALLLREVDLVRK
jgi:hypothetical protein